MSIVNLLPEDYFQRRSQRRANVLCVVMFAVVMGGVGAAAMLSERNTRYTRQVMDQVNDQYAEAAKKLTRMQQLKAQKRQSIIKAKATATLLERIPRSYLLAVITHALPENASLVELKLKSVRRTSVTSSRNVSKFASVRGKMGAAPAPELIMSVEVTGHAATDVQVAGFMTNLLKSPLLTGVDLGYSQEKIIKGDRATKAPDRKVREFKVVMELKSNVDVIDLIKPDPKDVAGFDGKVSSTSLGRDRTGTLRTKGVSS